MCLKDDVQKKQILPDKIDSDLRVDFKMTGHKNDMEKRCYAGHILKMADVFKKKWGIQITN